MSITNYMRAVSPNLKVTFMAQYSPECKKPIKLSFTPVDNLGEAYLDLAKVNVDSIIQDEPDEFLDLVLEYEKFEKKSNLAEFNAKAAAYDYFVLRELKSIHGNHEYFDLEFSG